MPFFVRTSISRGHFTFGGFASEVIVDSVQDGELVGYHETGHSAVTAPEAVFLDTAIEPAIRLYLTVASTISESRVMPILELFRPLNPREF